MSPHRTPIRPARPRHLVLVGCALLTVLLSLIYRAPDSSAVSAIERTFDELVGLADLVVVGTVTGAAGSRLPEGAVVTDYRLEEIAVLKGVHPAATPLIVRVLGGQAGDLALTVEGAPVLSLGDSVLLFIRGNMSDALPFVGVHQGVFRIGRDALGTRRVFDWQHRSVVAVRDGQVLMGTPDSQGIPLDDFIQQIAARLRP